MNGTFLFSAFFDPIFVEQHFLLSLADCWKKISLKKKNLFSYFLLFNSVKEGSQIIFYDSDHVVANNQKSAAAALVAATAAAGPQQQQQ